MLVDNWGIYLKIEGVRLMNEAVREKMMKFCKSRWTFLIEKGYVGKRLKRREFKLVESDVVVFLSCGEYLDLKWEV